MRPSPDALASVPFFSRLAPAHLDALLRVADLARLGPDECLFRQGDRLTEANFLLVGHVATTRLQAGTPVLADILEAVAPLCLPAALLGLPAPVGAQTASSARVLVIPVSVLRETAEADAALQRAILTHALNGMQALTTQVCDLKLRSSAQRLADYLLTMAASVDLSPPRFMLPFEKRLLAARIGCSQENLSRAFAALRRLGVETRRGSVVLRDVESLRGFAGAAADAPDGRTLQPAENGVA